MKNPFTYTSSDINMNIINSFYLKLKANNLPHYQLHPWTDKKSFFKIQDDINAQPEEIPSEPIVSALDPIPPIDDIPMLFEESPELLAVKGCDPSKLPNVTGFYYIYSTYKMARHLTKLMLPDEQSITTSDYLMVGEDVYYRLVYPRFFTMGSGDVKWPAYFPHQLMYPRLNNIIDSGWFFDNKLMEAYTAYLDASVLSKIWWTIYLVTYLYMLYKLYSPAFQKFHFYLTTKTPPSDIEYMNDIMKKPSPSMDIDADPVSQFAIHGPPFIEATLKIFNNEFDSEFFNSFNNPDLVQNHIIKENYFEPGPEKLIIIATDPTTEYDIIKSEEIIDLELGTSNEEPPEPEGLVRRKYELMEDPRFLRFLMLSTSSGAVISLLVMIFGLNELGVPIMYSNDFLEQYNYPYFTPWYEE
jgi:hypothetical protein